MSTKETALTVHLLKPDGLLDDAFLCEITGELQHKFGIQHSTIQFERGDPSRPCRLAPDEVV
jgi:cobalt-zinc-cadmium efflux system protein